MSKHPYAPGTIEHHRRPLIAPAMRRELLRWLQLALLAIAVTGGTALVAGLVTGLILRAAS